MAANNHRDFQSDYNALAADYYPLATPFPGFKYVRLFVLHIPNIVCHTMADQNVILIETLQREGFERDLDNKITVDETG